MNVVLLEPLLDVPVEQLGPVREPALALGRIGEQDVLEPTERTLAVDRDDQTLAQGLIGDRADELLHPAVLLTGGGRLYPQVITDVLGDLLTVEQRLGVTRGDRDDPPGRQIEIAVGVGRITFDRDLEGIPVEIDANRAAGCGWNRAYRHKLTPPMGNEPYLPVRP
jgi:hypothetical protein